MSIKLATQLKQHEGFRGKPYLDSVGKTTIGYGRNLDDVPMTSEEATLLLLNDIRRSEDLLFSRFPSYILFRNERRDVLVNMVFNMGIGSFSQFKKMHKALRSGNFEEASMQMLESRWAMQVGRRATELAEQMLTGRYSEG